MLPSPFFSKQPLSTIPTTEVHANSCPAEKYPPGPIDVVVGVFDALSPESRAVLPPAGENLLCDMHVYLRGEEGEQVEDSLKGQL